jgi:hypothetical protein
MPLSSTEQTDFSMERCQKHNEKKATIRLKIDYLSSSFPIRLEREQTKIPSLSMMTLIDHRILFLRTDNV